MAWLTARGAPVSSASWGFGETCRTLVRTTLLLPRADFEGYRARRRDDQDKGLGFLVLRGPADTSGKLLDGSTFLLSPRSSSTLLRTRKAGAAGSARGKWAMLPGTPRQAFITSWLFWFLVWGYFGCMPDQGHAKIAKGAWIVLSRTDTRCTKIMKGLALALLSLLFLCFSKKDYVAYYSTSCTAVDGPAVTRSQVLIAADKYARLHWSMAEVNQKGVSCGGNFTSRYPVGPRVGMGYKFGGWDTPDEFLSKIAQGHGTGTGAPEAYQAHSSDCVTGISCTGLVSRAWHLNHKYTLTYPDWPDVPRQFHEITQLLIDVGLQSHKTSSLKKGDAFLNRSHIILFVYETRDSSPMIIHSSTEGVRFEKITWHYLWSHGYIPIRYNNIRDDINPSGTIDNPITLDSDDFPCTLEGNTRDVVSMEFDCYSIAPSINQRGPEVVYRVRLRSSGTILIRITDCKNEGIDNDIHLLSSLRRGTAFEALDCAARGDQEIRTRLGAGLYYIVVDSGNDLPGEYRLGVEWADEGNPFQERDVHLRDSGLRASGSERLGHSE